MFSPPREENTWKPLRQIRSTKPSPPWFSPSALLWNETFGDLQTIRVMGLGATDQNLRRLALLSELLAGKRLLIRCRGEPRSSWLFVLGRLSDTCFLVWPAEKIRFSMAGDESYYLLERTLEAMSLFAMEDHTKVEAIDYTWASPTRQHILQRSSQETHGTRSCIRAVPRSKAMPLLQLAARRAFWSASRSWCILVAKELQIEMTGGMTLFEVLFQLVSEATKGSELDTLSILGLRQMTDPNRCNMGELMGVEGIRNELTKDGRKVLNNALDEAESRKRSWESFKESLVSKRAEFELKLEKKGASGRPKKVRSTASKARRSCPWFRTARWHKRMWQPCSRQGGQCGTIGVPWLGVDTFLDTAGRVASGLSGGTERRP